MHRKVIHIADMLSILLKYTIATSLFVLSITICQANADTPPSNSLDTLPKKHFIIEAGAGTLLTPPLQKLNHRLTDQQSIHTRFLAGFYGHIKGGLPLRNDYHFTIGIHCQSQTSLFNIAINDLRDASNNSLNFQFRNQNFSWQPRLGLQKAVFRSPSFLLQMAYTYGVDFVYRENKTQHYSLTNSSETIETAQLFSNNSEFNSIHSLRFMWLFDEYQWSFGAACSIERWRETPSGTTIVILPDRQNESHTAFKSSQWQFPFEFILRIKLNTQNTDNII